MVYRKTTRETISCNEQMSDFLTRNKLIHYAVMLACMMCAAPAFSDPPKLVFAAENSWPPFAKEDGTGLSRDIINQALAITGAKAEYLIVPYARALKMAENGQVDGAFNVTKQASTTSLFEFGTEPLFQAVASYYYAEPSQLNYSSVQEIPDYTSIAVILGYEYGNEYEQHRHRFTEVRVSQQRQIIQLLNEGKVDLAIMFDQVAQYTLAEMGLAPDSLRKGAVNHVSDIYVAFSRSTPDVAEKIQRLDDGLRALRIMQTTDDQLN